MLTLLMSRDSLRNKSRLLEFAKPAVFTEYAFVDGGVTGGDVFSEVVASGAAFIVAEVAVVQVGCCRGSFGIQLC